MRKLPLLAMLLGATVASADVLTLDFTGGGSSSNNVTNLVDAFSGAAGQGWASNWKGPGNGVSRLIETKDVNPLNQGWGNYLNLRFTSTRTDNIASGYISRRIANGPAGVDLTKDYTIGFSVRLDAALPSGGAGAGISFFADNSSDWLAGTQGTNTWAFRATAAGWSLPGVSGTVFSFDVGKTYDVRLEISPENDIFTFYVSDGENSYTSGDLAFRIKNGGTGGQYIYFGANQITAGQSAEFSIDRISVTQIPEASTTMAVIATVGLVSALVLRRRKR